MQLVIWTVAILALAAGQEPPALPSPLTLSEAMRIFRERGFDLLISQQQVESAQSDLETAGAIANPQISGALGKSFDYDPAACAGCSALQTSVGISDQGALFDLLVNKRGLRKDAASAALEAKTFDELYADALQARPDLKALESQIQRAESALALARRQRFPDVQLSASYTQEGTGNSALTPPTLTFGASLPLPIFYQQQGEVRKAESDLRTQTLQRAKTRAQVAQDVSQAFAAWQGGQKLVTRMSDRLLERAQKARDLARVQYEKGASSLLELLDAERTYISVHTEYVQDLSIYWTAVAQLEQAVGKELRQ